MIIVFDKAVRHDIRRQPENGQIWWDMIEMESRVSFSVGFPTTEDFRSFLVRVGELVDRAEGVDRDGSTVPSD